MLFRSTASMDRAKLKIQMYFAENDIMIGEGGREYFQKSWKQSGVEELNDVASMRSITSFASRRERVSMTIWSGLGVSGIKGIGIPATGTGFAAVQSTKANTTKAEREALIILRTPAAC